MVPRRSEWKLNGLPLSCAGGARWRLWAADGLSTRTQPRERTRGRRVQPERIAAGQPPQQVAGQRLAELDPPLVEAVDPPQRAADEDAVLVQRDQRAERPRRQPVAHQ